MVMNDEILKIRDVIVNTVPVVRIYLFGSYANGTQREDSDYDFYIVIPNDGMRPIDVMGDVDLAMRGVTKKAVDVLAGTAEGFGQRSKFASLERKIAREGVVLYEC